MEFFGQELLTAAFAVAFLSFFTGFALGRRRGKKEGFAEGLAYAPLEFRRRTWEEGRCVICGAGSAPEAAIDPEVDVEIVLVTNAETDMARDRATDPEAALPSAGGDLPEVPSS